MTQNEIIAVTAINKWLYYGWNYITKYFSWTDSAGTEQGEYLPEFLGEVKWTCPFLHMVGKWHKATESRNADAYLVRFYAELDNQNRQLLLEWVLRYYSGEKSIF